MILEEYCPNCNAILKKQKGFNPNLNYWVCKKCGEQLINPDSNKKRSPKYPDVVWYCDNCGAILNEQKYFNDSRGSWKCKECGYKNPIGESEIYNKDERTIIIDDYDSNKKEGLLGSLLGGIVEGILEDTEDDENEDNNDYDNEDDYYDDYDNEDDEDDYENEDNDDYDNEDNDDDDDDYENENENNDNYDDSNNDYDYDDKEKNNSYKPNYSFNYSYNEKSNSKSILDVIGIISFVVLMIILFSAIIFGIIAQHMANKEIEEKISKGMINAGYYDDYLKENYKMVEKQFEARGFTNIEVIKNKDLNPFNNGDVSNISINGNSKFTSSDYFYKTDKVIIEYK